MSLASLLERLTRRSAVINRFDRITGDAVELASSRLSRSRRHLGRDALQDVIEGLIGHQDRRVTRRRSGRPARPESVAGQRVLGALLEIVTDYRHGL